MDNHLIVIMKHLKSRRRLTSMIAFDNYMITRLADVIFRLREKGHNIRTIIKEDKKDDGRTIRYAEYKLEVNRG